MLNRMKPPIAKKLGIGFLFVSLLIVLVGYLGLNGIQRVVDSERSMAELDQMLNDIMALKSLGFQQFNSGMHFILLGDQQSIREFKDKGEAFKKKLVSLRSESPALTGSLEKIAAIHVRSEEVFHRVAKESLSTATLTEHKKILLHEIYHSIETEFIETITNIENELISEKSNIRKEAEAVYRNRIVTMAGAALFISLVAGFIGFYISGKISGSIVGLKDADGNVSCIEVFQDITDLKRMEIELLRSERYKTIADISRDIAHNFNNLLTRSQGKCPIAPYESIPYLG